MKEEVKSIALPFWFKVGAVLSPPQSADYTYDHSYWTIKSIDVENDTWKAVSNYEREVEFSIKELEGWMEFALPRDRS